MNEFNDIANRIIRENRYLTLATSSKNQAWATPLWYVYDQHNFYFISNLNSRHSQAIKTNPLVAGAIFNSQLKPNLVNGVQFTATAQIVPYRKLPVVIKLIYNSIDAEILKSRFNDYRNPCTYTQLTNFRIYQLSLLETYILDPHETKTDRRVQVNLSL